MKHVLFVMLLVLSFAIGTVDPKVAAGPAPALKERMPDVSRAILLDEMEHQCGPIVYTMRLYNTRGDGNDAPEDADLWLNFASKKSKRPFLAIMWAPPTYYQIDRMMMDLDLNGYADIVGLPYDEAFGNNLCEAYVYYLAHKKS